MPTIHMVDSIKIDVYGRDHPPPHFHAVYAGQEALVEISVRYHKWLFSYLIKYI